MSNYSSKFIRRQLLAKGFFPEVLPPCFNSEDLLKGFSGIVRSVDSARFGKRNASYIRYSGTKHDGSRRYYGTVHPIPYFSVCNFVDQHWPNFEEKINSSRFTADNINICDEGDDRAIIVSSLGEVKDRFNKQIKYAPYILKADISQFYPSIYTHTISWAAHGLQLSKDDQKPNSKVCTFNQLDWFIQRCQNAQTRGLIIGPDAFRLVAEYLCCEVDKQLNIRIGNRIVGGVRHVDDFYIGIESELEANLILSELRDVLQNFDLQINDNKTQILSGADTTDDIWSQELRALEITRWGKHHYDYALDKAHEFAKKLNSQSPMKLTLRRFDNLKVYEDTDAWEGIEPKLQRILYHYSHSLDYLCLLVVKRYAIGKKIDKEGWADAILLSLKRHTSFNHHHEISWLLWTLFVCDLDFPQELINDVLKTVKNSHISALIIAGFAEGYFDKKPEIKLGNSLNTVNDDWLHNFVAKSVEYNKAKFSGEYSQEFQHFCDKDVKLINFKKHIKDMRKASSRAISETKYGYESESESNDDDYWLEEEGF